MFLQKNHKKKTSAQYLNPDAAAKEPILHAAIWQTLFFVLATVYFELVLHIITGGGELRTYGYLILFSIAYAMLPALLSLLPCGRLLNSILLLADTIFFCTECFLFQSFQAFMSLSALLTTTDDVVGGFTSTMITTVLKGWWILLLFVLPSLIYLIFGRKLFSRPKRPGICTLCYALTMAIFCVLGVFAVNSRPADQAKYLQQYEFSSACRSFGLLTGSRLELKYMIFPNNSATQLQVVEIEPEPEPEDTAAPLPETPEAEPEPEPEYGENIMEIDFAGISETVTSDAVREMNQYLSALPGSKQNAYTGLFAGKNLILITAESFSSEVIDPERTPTLYRMATEGIAFTDYYQPAWGGSTSTGEYSNVTGLIPTDGVASIRTVSDYNLYFTLGNQLQRLGYFSAAYHNGSYTYYNRHMTHCNLGYSTFTGMGNGLEAGVTDQWPASDLEMMQFTLQDYIDRQPFSIYYMTVSGHGTYQKGANAMTAKNWDAVADMDASDTVKGYYAANLELEYAMAYLVEELEKAGIADDTVIVLATDHYPYSLEASSTWGNSTSYLPELYGYPADNNMTRDHSQLIIWSGCLEGMDLQVDTPTYSLDIVPTVSNLFGLEYDSRLLVGHDVFSDEIPLVIWRDYSWKTDRGYYDNNTGTFTPNKAGDVDQDYIDSVNALVQNKFALSNLELRYNYYGILFGEDE